MFALTFLENSHYSAFRIDLDISFYCMNPPTLMGGFLSGILIVRERGALLPAFSQKSGHQSDFSLPKKIPAIKDR